MYYLENKGLNSIANIVFLLHCYIQMHKHLTKILPDYIFYLTPTTSEIVAFGKLIMILNDNGDEMVPHTTYGISFLNLSHSYSQCF